MAVKFSLREQYGSTTTYVQETTTVDFTSETIVAGDYWRLSSPLDDYYVWYTVDSVGTDPEDAGRTGIQVDILSGDSVATRASKTQSVLDAHYDFSASVATNVVTVTSIQPGNVTDAVDVNCGLGVTVTQQGNAGDSAPTTNANFKTYEGQNTVHMYYYYPVRRPIEPVMASYSYKQHIYAQFIGDGSVSPEAYRNPRWEIFQLPGKNTRLYYGTRNTYSNSTDFDGSLMLVTTGQLPLTIKPKLHNGVNPTSASTIYHWLPGGSIYTTNFLVLQLWVDPSDWDDVGNTAQIVIRFTVDEYS